MPVPDIEVLEIGAPVWKTKDNVKTKKKEITETFIA